MKSHQLLKDTLKGGENMSKLFAKLLSSGPQQAAGCATQSGYAYRCAYSSECPGFNQNTSQKAIKDPAGNICGPWKKVACGCIY